MLFLRVYSLILLAVSNAKLLSDLVTTPPLLLCPRNHFLTDTDYCQPFFNCGHERIFKVLDELQVEFVKRLFLAKWEGVNMVYSVLRYNLRKEDFLHGVTMLDSFQNTRFVPEIVGYCTDPDSPYVSRFWFT